MISVENLAMVSRHLNVRAGVTCNEEAALSEMIDEWMREILNKEAVEYFLIYQQVRKKANMNRRVEEQKRQMKRNKG